MKTIYLSIHNIIITSLILIAGLIASSCGSDEPAPDPEPTRTVIVYMVANNNLGTNGYDRLDIEEMRSVASSIPDGSHLVVYHAGRRKSPELKEITAAADVTLKTYEGGYTDGLSLTPARMKEVFADVERLAPADSYGLVLWSHGTGWVETDESRSGTDILTVTDTRVSTLSFGNDNGFEMNVTSLSEALQGRKFDFLYFDCCLMGSVEVAYQLRDAAPYIVASPTELQVYGMRYDRNIPVFFSKEPDMVQAAKNTFSYYNDGTDGVARACSMCVIDTKEMKGLADATRAIMATGALPSATYKPVTFYNRYRNAIADMTDYITSLPGVDESLIAAWREAFGKAVIYSAATPAYGSYDLSRFGGLACAALMSADDVYYKGYDNQAWFDDVVSHNKSLFVVAD